MTRDDWKAADYARDVRFVSDLGAPVLELLAPQAGERILDLGCGDGALTEKLVAAGCEVLGLDASPDMIAAARARGLRAELADGHGFDAGQGWDAVFSNAALHWMTRPDAVIACIARALRPGGRFVAEFGGFGNVAAIRTALIAVLARRGIETDLSGIWYFPTAEEHRARLEAAGFTVREIRLIPRPTPVTAGMRSWLSVLSAPVLGMVPQAERDAVIAETEALLAPALRSGEGLWYADYVRLRLAADLPEE